MIGDQVQLIVKPDLIGTVTGIALYSRSVLIRWPDGEIDAFNPQLLTLLHRPARRNGKARP